MAEFRIMSNNIWDCRGNKPWWQERGFDCSAAARTPYLARVYAETLPDVIGLQESGKEMIAELMASLGKLSLPYSLLWGSYTSMLINLDKFDLVDSEFRLFNEQIPELEGKFNNGNTKSYNIAVLRSKADGKLLTFATAHLWWMSSDEKSPEYYPSSDEARAYQMNLLLDRVDYFRNKYSCPAIVVGDMNAVYSSPALRSALARGYLHAHDIATDFSDETNGFHYCYPDGFNTLTSEGDFSISIDHALVWGLPEGAIRRFERYTPDYYMPISDHFPMWIDIDF